MTGFPPQGAGGVNDPLEIGEIDIDKQLSLYGEGDRRSLLVGASIAGGIERNFMAAPV